MEWVECCDTTRIRIEHVRRTPQVGELQLRNVSSGRERAGGPKITSARRGGRRRERARAGASSNRRRCPGPARSALCKPQIARARARHPDQGSPRRQLNVMFVNSGAPCRTWSGTHPRPAHIRSSCVVSHQHRATSLRFPPCRPTRSRPFPRLGYRCVATSPPWALVAPKGKWRSSGLAAVVDPRRCERSAKAKVASFLSAAPILNAYDLSRSANRLWIGVAVSAACRLTRILAGGGQTIGRRTFAAQAPFADPVA